ncbi:patatin-like phospholipase family protein [Polaromonas sp. SM01]|uniref:patatin-like phospholipase family protein n=1 Tax=Polaromonas sp. SM01 TaxID=3085630 RepID=UPI002980AC0D|nr:patatin-like phospholipase family protein [Polaromonas sp. SM01]MDW5444736.1 patatin-like phospholipase family protein [Polaromonas sp. SM01]
MARHLLLICRRCALVLLAVALVGCSSVRPWINAPLADGVIPQDPDRIGAVQGIATEDPSMLVAVTLSGGGARAAAFGYGVLQALHQTPLAWNGRQVSLLDHVGFVSGVSGGSIVAAYYAAFGEETFERFEPEFLRQNFQDSLISLALKPASLVELSSPWMGRSQLLERRLNELYRGKTFADMWGRAGRPRLLISATDLSLGSTFDFSWTQFSLICSDLASVPLSFAVASSSAVPLVLSPLTVKNYAGNCAPPDSVEAPPADATGSYRTRLLRSQINSYQDAAARPYIHLVDGGVADNLGLRSLLDRSMSAGGIRRALGDLPRGTVRKLVLIAVNAERDPAERIDESDQVPTTLQVVDAMLFGTGARATQETLGLLRDVSRQWQRELDNNSGGKSAFADDAEIYVINVNLRDAPEAAERSRLLQIPTAFSIPADDVTRLIQAGRQVLRSSPDFKRLVGSLPSAVAPQPKP